MITDDEWDKLLAQQWFPFISLRQSTIKDMIGDMRSGFDLDDLTERMAGEFDPTLSAKLDAWRANPFFRPHIQFGPRRHELPRNRVCRVRQINQTSKRRRDRHRIGRSDIRQVCCIARQARRDEIVGGAQGSGAGVRVNETGQAGLGAARLYPGLVVSVQQQAQLVDCPGRPLVDTLISENAGE